MVSWQDVRRSQRHVINLIYCRDQTIGHRLKQSLQIFYKGFGLLGVWKSECPWGDKEGNGVGILTTRLVILHSDWYSGSRDLSSARKVVPPVVEATGQQPLQLVHMGFQSGVAGEVPGPPQPILQMYLILNTVTYRRPWVVTRARLGSSRCQRLQNGAGVVLNERVDSHLIL